MKTQTCFYQNVQRCYWQRFQTGQGEFQLQYLKKFKEFSIFFLLYFCFEIEFLMVYGWLYLIILLNNRITWAKVFFLLWLVFNSIFDCVEKKFLEKRYHS